MLEFIYYNTKKINDLKDFFTVVFVLIDDVYNKIIPPSIKNRMNISDSKLSDSEIISITLGGKIIDEILETFEIQKNLCKKGCLTTTPWRKLNIKLEFLIV